MFLSSQDRWLANHLPTESLKDFYPRAMRRLTEMGLLGGKTVRETKHGFQMQVDRLDAIKWYIHYYGEFEPLISQAFKSILPKGGTVIDIGGNIGYHAILAATAVGPQGKVFTFEPARAVSRELEYNIRLNGLANVHLTKAAVSNRRGTAELFGVGDNELGSSSLIDRGNTTSTETVQLITFDDIATMTNLRNVDLIKIDVEGAEQEVIEGMIPHIPTLRRECAIFLEVSGGDDRLIRPFTDGGFISREIRNIYTTKFYRDGSGTQSRDLIDLVLCRDESVIDRATAN
jgi:FkbM family methyltransferase